MGEEEEESVIISCMECGATADYDTPCPNGCDQLTMYFREEVYKNVDTKDWDALGSISFTELIELVKQSLEEDE